MQTFKLSGEIENDLDAAQVLAADRAQSVDASQRSNSIAIE
jgi:hypothetical protein